MLGDLLQRINTLSIRVKVYPVVEKDWDRLTSCRETGGGHKYLIPGRKIHVHQEYLYADRSRLRKRARSSVVINANQLQKSPQIGYDQALDFEST